MKGKIKFPSGAIEVVNWSTSTKITAHFTVGEYANPSAPEADKFILTPEALIHAIMLEELRVWYGKPMAVNSWYRSPQYNRIAGGIASSNHLRGTATDIKTGPLTDAQFANLSRKWRQICEAHGVVGEILRYSTFVHFGSNITYSKTFYIEDKRAA